MIVSVTNISCISSKVDRALESHMWRDDSYSMSVAQP
jgi:hypothetical protein